VSQASLSTGLRQLERRSQHSYYALPFHGAVMLGLLAPAYLLAGHAPVAGPLRLDLLDSQHGLVQFYSLWTAAVALGAAAAYILRGPLVGAMCGLCRRNLATGIFDDHLLMLTPQRLPTDRWPDPANIYKRLTELLRDYDEICWRRGLRIYPPLHEFVILRGRYLIYGLLALVIAGLVLAARYGPLWFPLYIAGAGLLVVAVPILALIHSSIPIGMARGLIEHTRQLHGAQAVESALPATA
jgi:hypothetical protein